MNHSTAGAISGLVISWGNGPVNMIGSALTIGAISGYLASTDPMLAQAASFPSDASSHSENRPVHVSAAARMMPAISSGSAGAESQPSKSKTDPFTCDQNANSCLWLQGTALGDAADEPKLAGKVAKVVCATMRALRPKCRACSLPAEGIRTRDVVESDGGVRVRQDRSDCAGGGLGQRDGRGVVGEGESAARARAGTHASVDSGSLDASGRVVFPSALRRPAVICAQDRGSSESHCRVLMVMR
jgi:hypothetical protein